MSANRARILWSQVAILVLTAASGTAFAEEEDGGGGCPPPTLAGMDRGFEYLIARVRKLADRAQKLNQQNSLDACIKRLNRVQEDLKWGASILKSPEANEHNLAGSLGQFQCRALKPALDSIDTTLGKLEAGQNDRDVGAGARIENLLKSLNGSVVQQAQACTHVLRIEKAWIAEPPPTPPADWRKCGDMRDQMNEKLVVEVLEELNRVCSLGESCDVRKAERLEELHEDMESLKPFYLHIGKPFSKDALDTTQMAQLRDYIRAKFPIKREKGTPGVRFLIISSTNTMGQGTNAQELEYAQKRATLVNDIIAAVAATQDVSSLRGDYIKELLMPHYRAFAEEEDPDSDSRRIVDLRPHFFSQVRTFKKGDRNGDAVRDSLARYKEWIKKKQGSTEAEKWHRQVEKCLDPRIVPTGLEQSACKKALEQIYDMGVTVLTVPEAFARKYPQIWVVPKPGSEGVHVHTPRSSEKPPATTKTASESEEFPEFQESSKK